MKLNRRGYMLVEIIIASVLAFGVAYYLLNLTYKFKNANTDLHESYIYTKDKLVITKNIMSDLENGIVSDVSRNDSEVTFKIHLGDKVESRKLVINKTDKSIEYGKTDDAYNIFEKNDPSYYKKNLEKSLDFSGLSIVDDDNSFCIKISLSSMYTDNIYDILLYSSFEGDALLSNKKTGDYVKYEGTNGCESDFCFGNNYINEFDAFGWRIAYVKDGATYLISAGAPEKFSLSTNKDKYNNELNNIALKYCNPIYVYGGECNNDNVWAVNDVDFWKINGGGSGSILTSCVNKNTESCGYSNELISNGNAYWFAANSKQNEKTFYWSEEKKVILKENDTELSLGVRPVIKLNTNVIVIGGDGTKENPYEISFAN